MKVLEAKNQIIELLKAQLGMDDFLATINPESPDPRDEGKFSILGKPARTIHRYNGWNLPINRYWFSGGEGLPKVNFGEFCWYAFAIPKQSGFMEKCYYICDYLKIREWAMDFDAPLGNDHRHNNTWRADIQVYGGSRAQQTGYFRWGDEPVEIQNKPSRVIILNNIYDILDLQQPSGLPGRVSTEVSRIVRDTNVVKYLKTLYENRCQICKTVIGLPKDNYSEAHHIKPLGHPHEGFDIQENIMILCPNHHAEFDLGTIAIDPNNLEVIHIDTKNQFSDLTLYVRNGHNLSRDFLNYHLQNKFNK